MVSTKNAAFQRWVHDFRARAAAGGIPTEILDAAFTGIKYNTDVVQKDRTQNEFTKTVWVYLDSAASDARIAAGKKAMKKHAALLGQIEKRYGVEKEIVTAIWGLESAYGSFRGSIPTIEALATLAFDGRRGAFFETQLLDALKILNDGHTSPAGMKGSWAGAMGHTQFMPSSWHAHAVDYDRDGKRDIWGDDPADALASAANYLKANGWETRVPWGIEVRLPEGFNYLLARRDLEKMPSEWANLGVKDIRGNPVPDHGPATILLPGGAEGAAFMIFRNFAVIESYNTADAYVIGVGHLADRIAGGPPIQGGWPREDRALTLPERMELQTLLRRHGFDPQKLDGKIGPLTIDAVRSFQKAHGLTPDGYASPGFLQTLRRMR
ncbi:lytic murein transglycosylase [Marimonas arenosa]|uniref:Lytic murein transglycosylase n=2 Tax=Marimonas arenosa TaxID=1795305 RepID=A0AAE4B4Y2_9RHOB|nr:lytic murein transglycosylase [Marimonas arenosa]MDQ2090710.1 lytic murein transglycosylase [Marimonas arenosa]